MHEKKQLFLNILFVWVVKMGIIMAPIGKRTHFVCKFYILTNKRYHKIDMIITTRAFGALKSKPRLNISLKIIRVM